MNNLAIALPGAAYLAQLVDQEGRFRYRFDSVSGNVADGYNVLRHCGAVWAMLEVSEYSDQKKGILASGIRAVTYLLNEFMRFSPDYRSGCIAENNSVKLGGNALAILAMLSVYRATGDDILKMLAESLGKYILKDLKPDGDFVHKRYLTSGKISDFKSMYYTGEALLALLFSRRPETNSGWRQQFAARMCWHPRNKAFRSNPTGCCMRLNYCAGTAGTKTMRAMPARSRGIFWTSRNIVPGGGAEHPHGMSFGRFAGLRSFARSRQMRQSTGGSQKRMHGGY